LTKKALDLAVSMVEPGRSTKEIDDEVNRFLTKSGGKAAFLGYKGYPASICISVNQEVVHGIPLKHKKLREGEIVSFDVGALLGGFCGDAALTVPVGHVPEKAKRLMAVTKQALHMAVDHARPGNRIGDIGAAVQGFVEKNGFSVVRDYVGHCIGRKMHEEPQIPNYGIAGTGPKLKAGMVVALEPMVNEGTFAVRLLSDNWTVVTLDGRLSAHFEHTVAVTSEGPEILSE
jgi:methionyl aminopeptidase